MKAPEKIIEQRTCIFQSDNNCFKIGDLREIIKQYDCSYEDVEVELVIEGYEYEESYTLKCFIMERLENKLYEEELKQYNAHIDAQRKIKLAWKEKAKAELEERLAKIEEEIEELVK